MGQLIDLSGERFGRLIVIRKHSTINRQPWWYCRCDCGVEKVIKGDALRSGKTRSCGCLHREVFHNLITRHGSYGTKLYYVWNMMKQRCHNSKNKDYKHYGGRGIKLCKEWLNFSCFEVWALEAGYSPGLSIERINNDGDYSPANCTWIPLSDQKKNTRASLVNRKIEVSSDGAAQQASG